MWERIKQNPIMIALTLVARYILGGNVALVFLLGGVSWWDSVMMPILVNGPMDYFRVFSHAFLPAN